MARIVAVHSYRGGTGKSNLSGNLAATLARQGGRVALVDADIQSPGVHVLFGFDAASVERTLNDYLWGTCAIEAVAYDVSAVLEAAGGAPPPASGALYLLPASIQAGHIARILREGYDAELLNDGLDELVERLALDYVILDTHPGLLETTLSCVASADAVVVVLRPDLQDYQGTAVIAEIARKLNVPELQLVVNMVLPRLDPAALRLQVARTYGVPVAGVLPAAEELLQLASQGIFCLRYPDHPWSRELCAIADRLTVAQR
jgi:MinD-like ATPase involved in chromosome partitioning or flagellar assembly